MITYTSCPACHSTQIRKVLTAQDFTVSHQPFDIWECAACTLRFTQHIPSPGEIGNYYKADSYISHTDTKEGIVNRLYHFVRKTTMRHKRKLIAGATGLQNGALLDIGAGTGSFAAAMQQGGWQVTGLEPDAAARDRALQLHGLHVQESAVLFDLPRQSFDAITMWHVLEHVHDLHTYIAQIKELLRPEGRLFIAVPNYTSYDAAVYREYWAAYDVPRHLYHFSPASIQQLMAKHGLKVTTMRPMWFDSFYIAMLSGQYKTGRVRMVQAMWTGFISNCKAFFNRQRCSSVIYVVRREIS